MLIQITDPFLLPDGTNWTGTIIYTLLYATTLNGSTVVGAQQALQITNGISIQLAPGLYTVQMNQSGLRDVITAQWGVPTSGGPYTVAEISSNVTLQAPALLSNTVVLNTAAQLALATVPVVLVPSPGPSQIIYPTLLIAQQVNATTVTDDNQLSVGYGAIGSFSNVDGWDILQGTGAPNTVNSLLISFPLINGDPSSVVGQPLIGYADDAVTQPDGPSGNMYITTYYSLFEVGA